MPRPKKYPTEEERREAVRQSYAQVLQHPPRGHQQRRAKAYKRKRAAIKAGQKET